MMTEPTGPPEECTDRPGTADDDSDEVLDALRQQLRQVDRRIIAWLERRMSVIESIARHKAKKSLPIFQPKREHKVIETISKLPLNRLPRDPLLKLFRSIMAISRDVEMTTLRSVILASQPRQPNPKSELPFQTVMVVGLGVMGGSLTLALRSQCPGIVLFGVDIDPAAREAASGFVDHVAANPDARLDHADVVILAVPVRSILQWLQQWGPRLSRQVVLDVGSVKAAIMEAAAAYVPSPAVFIGGHPLCGSERSGFAAADPLMYFDHTFFLCKPPALPHKPVLTVLSLMNLMGACPTWIDPACHDRTMALTSHLPQLMISALAAFLDQSGDWSEDLRRHAGPGLRSTLRLAGSSYTIWRDILETNPTIADVLQQFIVYLQQGHGRDHWATWFHDARHIYDLLYACDKPSFWDKGPL